MANERHCEKWIRGSSCLAGRYLGSDTWSIQNFIIIMELIQAILVLMYVKHFQNGIERWLTNWREGGKCRASYPSGRYFWSDKFDSKNANKYCKHLIFREYLIPRFRCLVSNSENKKLRKAFILIFIVLNSKKMYGEREGASRDFTRILIPRVQFGNYSLPTIAI